MNHAQPQKAPASAFIALGANLGEPLAQLDAAVQQLNNNGDINCLAMSRVYQSRPHGPQDQADFFNAVVAIRTTLPPLDLLAVMQSIEDDLGRVRKRHWGERCIDLDLILYNDLILQTPTLTIPHPLAHAREFVVKPLYDLDSTLGIPGHGHVADLLLQLPTQHLTEVRSGTTYNH